MKINENIEEITFDNFDRNDEISIEDYIEKEDTKETVEDVYERLSLKKIDKTKDLPKNSKIDKKQKHNYTNELELKSLLIRIKNRQYNEKIQDSEYEEFSTKLNNKINKYILLYIKLKKIKYDNKTKASKLTKLRKQLKERIVSYSEITAIDSSSYERFGIIILLMIKNILRRPQFSGYTYKDDFYSDAVYKILKYLHNFNHKLISKITHQPVNAFSYISQYIHNSVIYIIKTKKKENDRLKKQVNFENLSHNMQLKTMEMVKNDNDKIIPEENIFEVVLDECDSLVNELIKLEPVIKTVDRLNLYYPSDYTINIDEYNQLKPLLVGKVSIMRLEKKEEKTC